MEEEIKEILKGIYKERPKGTYFRKYDFGMVLVIGGGNFYSGSPALSAMAALETGTDMTRIIAPKRAADIIAGFSPDLAAYPLKGDYISKCHLTDLISMTESAKAVSRGNLSAVIGGGMGRSPETQETILEYISKVDVPMVIDADAIYALNSKPEGVKLIAGKDFLITPHKYEFFVLTGKDIEGISHADKVEVVREEAGRLKTNILLKESPDIISNGKDVLLNKVGSPYMSVGGTGDSLAGICGALMARRINPFKAAQIATYINGRAGEIAAERRKDSLKATDVISTINQAIFS